MPTKNIRFLLKEIEIYYDGDDFVPEGKTGRMPYSNRYKADKKKFDNIVEARLEYPRSGVALVTTTKMMDLPSRRLVKLDTADFWESGLFKEDIDSETRLKLTVSDRDSVGLFGRWFRKMLGSIFKSTTSGKVSAISNLFQGAVASDLQSRFIDGLKGPQQDTAINALCASKDINLEFKPTGVEAYYQRGKSKVNVLSGNEIAIDLYATAPVTIVVGRRRVPGRRTKQAIREVKFRKNQRLGVARVLLVGA